jgi:hypothetical protein
MLRYAQFTQYLQLPYLYTLFHYSLHTGDFAGIFPSYLQARMTGVWLSGSGTVGK